MSHEEYKEMLAAHALGALDAAEVRALEAHLATCADCRAELSEWLDTSAALAYSAPRVEPSISLRSRLLENIRAEKSESASLADNSRAGGAAIDVVREAKQETAETNVIQMLTKPRSSWNTMQRFGALAASLAFAAFIITLVVLWNRNRSMQAEVARLSRDLQTTQQQLKREREISEMFAAPDTRVATLTGTEMAPRAQARLAYNKAGSAMMIVDGLPAAPAGKDYQIWFIADGKPVPGGVFKPDTAGHVEMHDQIPTQARNAAAFAITLEPQGGTPAPTGQKYLLSTASS
jgi:anti-sigma-K factor RskA